MTDQGSPIVAHTAGVRCECYPEECQFAMQAGVFEAGTDADAVLSSLRPGGGCPTCGGTLEAWDTPFPSSAPGRPAEW